MNERLRELAEQAANGMLSFDAEGEWRLGEKEVEKYAELIVKKCGEVAVFGDPKFSAQHNIHKHFGVE